MYMPNMELHVVIHCLPLLLVLLAVDAFESNNNVSDSSRTPRSSRRVVRLYSGTRPAPLVCLGEGFQADPENCAVFYRCMKSGRGRFMSFKFQCAPGTIYDPETEVCNHPSTVKRSGCGLEHTVSVSDQKHENVEQIPENVLEEVQQELPSPISTKHPFYTEISSSFSTHPFVTSTKKHDISTAYPWITSTNDKNRFSTIPTKLSSVQTTNHIFTEPSFSSTRKHRSTTPRPSITRQPSIQTGDLCRSEGFMEDSENCRKFYRCISNSRGGFIRYEFMCTESTIWDDDIQSCNHGWAVKRRRCGRGNLNDGIDAQENINQDAIEDFTTHRIISSSPEQQTNYGLLVSQTQKSSSYVTQSQTKTTVTKTTIKSNPTTISPMDVQTQNYMSSTDKRASSEDDDTDDGYNNINMEPSKKPDSNECLQSGFMGDENDCQKFYRCVDNGRGSYTKYEFSCGDGTVWDPNLEACNHAWAVKECGGKASTQVAGTTTTSRPGTSTKTTPAYATSTTVSTKELQPTTEDNEHVGYGNQNQNPSTQSTTIQLSSSSATLVTKQPGNSCTSSGFMGDENDCKKFYRCVDNGDGSFTRYEFTCGEGTVWDADLEACNHAWAVKECGVKGSIQGTGIATTSGSIVTSTPSTQTSASYVPSSHITADDDENVGYGNHGQESSSTSSTTELRSSSNTIEITKQPENSCTASGFMGDKNDCKKFYRCVDNGDGSYTRYDFSCGEGTVWDSNIEACNHPWAVPKCGGSLSNTTETFKPTTTVTKATTYSPQAVQTENDDLDSGYGVHNDAQPPQIDASTSTTTTTSSQPHDFGNNCTSPGFMGDQYDCKKFFRCVDNGNGGFTRYEFTCGEGTVWDPEIEACNHAWAVEKCSGSLSNEMNKEEGTTSQGNTVSPSPVTSTSDENEIDTGYGQSSSQSTIMSSSESPSANEVQTSNKCKSNGFIGDKNNCKKFYRCVDNGNGGYTSYEFTCGVGTVWDPKTQACNHEWAVEHCEGSSTNKEEVTTVHDSSPSVSKQPENDEMYPNNNTTEEPSFSESSSTENTGEIQTSSQSTATCQSEGFYGDPNDCKKFYRCVDNGKGNFTKYDFTCGDGTVWDQEIQACDHESNSKCQQNSAGSEIHTKPTTGAVSTSTLSNTDASTTTSSTADHSPQALQTEDNCTSEGFHANSKDCRKFYRCVENEKGEYTKYDFSCGEGTMWVQEIQACDHQDDDLNCSNSSVTKPYSEDQQSTTEQQSSSLTSTSSTSTMSSETTKRPNDEYQDNQANVQENDICSSEGFYPDKNDCRKFYRCVKNGEGSYTRYDFSCGEGTAWDTDTQTCNHISQVSRCKSASHEDDQNKPMQDEGVSQTTEGSTEKTTTSPSENSKPSSKDTCASEGYFGNTKDCNKFYRCVDNGNGGYTKYDYDCGEGTIWDQDVQTCNHPQDVVNPSCSQSNEQSETSSSSTSTTQSSSTDTENTSQSSSNCSQENTTKKPANQNITCEKAGYYPNPNDCKKFYRCVDWDGNGERFSVYHFECGEGTIWDPQLDTCNHEESVYPPRDCTGVQSQTENVAESSSEGSSSTSQQTTESTSETTSTEQTTSQETTTQASPTTIGTTTQQSTTPDSTTTQQSTTTESTTTQQTMTTESTTTQQSTNLEETTTSTKTEMTTTQQSTTEGTTTQQSTTESTTTQQITEGTTTQQSTTESTTTQQTTEGTATQQSTTGSTTTQQTTEGTTTQQSTTESTTTQQTTEGTTSQSTAESSITESTPTEQSTSEGTTTEQTTEGTTTQQSTTDTTTTQQSTIEDTTTQQTEETTSQKSTTTESTTTQQTTTSEGTTSTTEESSTQQSTSQTDNTASTTTEESTNNQSTTESMSSTESSSSSKECPDTDDDQYLYVCPTSFRRHPKYCNMFYQCTEDDDSHEPKIAVFSCPNNTIYDESKTQCVEENKAEKKCDGQISQRRRVKRLNTYYKEPIVVGRDKLSCSSTGYFPFEKTSECSPAFLKCQKAKSGLLRGYVHLCPEGYLYWSISKRCERNGSLKDCKTSTNDWNRRWEIPVEHKNVAL